jgi:hypothetical protein
MAFRSVGLMRIRSTTIAQPLIGSWITAGIGGPTNIPTTVTLGDAAAASGFTDAQLIFRTGDPVWLIDPNGKNAEPAVISSVANAVTNQITLGVQQSSGAGKDNPVTINPHVSGILGTGTFILLKANVNNVYVQMEDNTGGTFSYIGDYFGMTASYRRIVKLAKVNTGVQPQSWSATESFGGNPFDSSELWILGGSGNSNDGYTPSLMLV